MEQSKKRKKEGIVFSLCFLIQISIFSLRRLRKGSENFETNIILECVLVKVVFTKSL